MPKISKINLRQLFARGLKPAQEAFFNLFDSYWHKDDLIDISAVKFLQNSLDNKLDSGAESTLMQAFENALGTAVQAKWSAVDVFEEYNNKVLKKLSAYVGGSGTPPTAHVGEYYKADGGFTTDRDLAANFKENFTIIEPAQTTFVAEKMVPGKNIANPAKKQSGKYVNWETGTLDGNLAYNAYDKLAVDGNADYYLHAVSHFAWYNSTGVFISGVFVGGSGLIAKSPSNAAYLSASFVSSNNQVQIEKGTVATAYEPYYEIQTITIPDLNVSEKQINFPISTVYGKNRFDKEKTIAGKYVNAFTGLLSDNPSYEASDYCYIKGLSQITLTSLYHIAFYDANKVFLSGREYGGDTIDVPVNAVWCRNSLLTGLSDFFQIESGIFKTNYERFISQDGKQIENLLPEDIIDNNIQSTIVTPSVMYWLKGKEMNVYFDSSIYHPLGESRGFYNSVYSSEGKFMQEKFRVSPDVTFDFKLKTESAREFIEKTTTVNVAAAASGTGITRKVLVIGDSTVNHGYTIKYISDFFANDNMHVEFIGTRTSQGVKHEGRSGWRLSNYMNDASFGDFSNAFWNGTKFSFSDYLTTSSQNMTDGDWVFIQLGINDIYSAALLNGSVNIYDLIFHTKKYLAEMIANIKSVNSNLRIGIIQTIPPAMSQDGTGNLLNSAIYSLEYYIKKGLVPWWNELLKTYDNTEMRDNKIYLIGATSVLDRVNNFQKYSQNIDSHNTDSIKVVVDDVHPSLAGYQQIGDAYIGVIKYFA
ncbi:SGNH/GDSL hydrolase family protein [Chryseobacterium sp.]|uniref:SGNH/GDSL hydrolase family protein n=1 Tax=Chryseobacterium sp. TaxID=1871047 RepID=UPI002FCC00EE